MENSIIIGNSSNSVSLESEMQGTFLTKNQAREMPLYQYYSYFVKVYKAGRVAKVTLNKHMMVARRLKEIAPKMKLKDVDGNRQNIQLILDIYGKNHMKQTTLDFKGNLIESLRAAVDDGYISQISDRNFKVRTKESYMDAKEVAELHKRPKTISSSDFMMLKLRVDVILEDLLQKEPIWSSNCGHVAPSMLCDQSKYLVLSILMHTGCRFSEALGITIKDVNELSIQINKSWDYKEHPNCFKKTKNSYSMRDVRVDKTIVDLLIKFDEWKRKYSQYGSDDPIWKTNEANVNSSGFIALFRRIQKKYGVEENISIHKIRHTYISYMLERGIDENLIAAQVGHADTNMIHKVYGHLLKDREEKDVLKIRAFMR
ncbi:site-specific integrase [Liquorilactobacillus nagelii]|uniref:site-specific integrase n=1 Tax=Liquorilactobacillus nagelii TaxID=82688 RepID=UPI0039EB9DC2